MADEQRRVRIARDVTSQDLIQANVPRRYWTAKLQEIPGTAPYKDVVRKYVAGLERMAAAGIGLYLWSEHNGTGKTAISSIVLKRAVSLGYSAFFSRSEELKESAVEGRMYDEHYSIRERVRTVDVLVIDDFGKEFSGASGYSENLLEAVVRERAQWLRPTIITSNLAPDKIGVRFTADLADVLREAALVLRIVGPEAGGKLWRSEERLKIQKLLDG